MNTCQICGREIKANTGVIAHHGYTRPSCGWQTSSCTGARYQPYEVSCDRIPVAIESIETFIKGSSSQLKSLTSNPPERIAYLRGHTVVKVEKPENFDPNDTWAILRPFTYACEYSKQIGELERAIRSAKFDLKFLKERLAAWVAPEKEINHA